MDNTNHILWYREPAASWIEALPVGNGRLGGMVYGGAAEERVRLNEDTLWSGGPSDWNNPDARTWLPRARAAALAGRHEEAAECCRKMQGPYNQSYQPLGTLHLRSMISSPVTGYYRELDLARGVAMTRFTVDGVVFTREVIASHPDQVIAIRLRADRPGAVNVEARLESPHPVELSVESESTIAMRGRVPRHVEPNYYDKSPDSVLYGDEAHPGGMGFTGLLRAAAVGGEIELAPGGTIRIANADEVTFHFAASSSFNGFDRCPASDGVDPDLGAMRDLATVGGKTFEEILADHVRDHAELFNRSVLELSPSRSDRSTIERLEGGSVEDDPGLAALLYDFGRYLLIASSRPGSQPTHLQGIWSMDVRPPWSDNWTLNINSTMNYWPAQVCNLPECHLPLVDFLKELVVNGRETARINYGAKGWVAHHNADIWRQTSPSGDYGAGDPVWANWAFGGVWHCMDLWEYYAFTGDEDFLRETAYPMMRGAAEFCLDWFVPNADGQLVVAPASSPENCFIRPEDGGVGEVCAGTAQDTALAWDLATNLIWITEHLGIDTEFGAHMREFREKLLPYQVGSKGQLLEWDKEYEEQDPHHRHMSHLIGFHPGRQITVDDEPALSAAVRRSMELRGDEASGWSMAWKVAIWARLRDGDRAAGLIAHLLSLVGDMSVREACDTAPPGGIYPNLFSACPPLMIDANFGVAAAIAEMLLQSHRQVGGVYELHLLPALPSAWSEGRISGLRARGGFEVDMSWTGGLLDCVRIRTLNGSPLRVRYGEQIIEHELEQGGVFEPCWKSVTPGTCAESLFYP